MPLVQQTGKANMLTRDESAQCSEGVSDLGPPVYGPFKAVSASLVVPDGLSDLFLCGHDKWT